MYFAGVDPDLHDCAFGIVDSAGMPVLVALASVDDEIKGRDAVVAMISSMKRLFGKGLFPSDWNSKVLTVAVEAQEFSYTANAGIPPGDVGLIAVVAGQAMLASACLWPCPFVHPAPQAWKGSVPKQIHQARLYTDLGIPFKKMGSKEKGYCVPSFHAASGIIGLDLVKKESSWKHLGDALALARFAKMQYEYASMIARRRAEALSTNG